MKNKLFCFLLFLDSPFPQQLTYLKDNGMVVNQITTLLEHYESTNPLEMTKKLNSINSLKH